MGDPFWDPIFNRLKDDLDLLRLMAFDLDDAVLVDLLRPNPRLQRKLAPFVKGRRLVRRGPFIVGLLQDAGHDEPLRRILFFSWVTGNGRTMAFPAVPADAATLERLRAGEFGPPTKVAILARIDPRPAARHLLEGYLAEVAAAAGSGGHPPSPTAAWPPGAPPAGRPGSPPGAPGPGGQGMGPAGPGGLSGPVAPAAGRVEAGSGKGPGIPGAVPAAGLPGPVPVAGHPGGPPAPPAGGSPGDVPASGPGPGFPRPPGQLSGGQLSAGHPSAGHPPATKPPADQPPAASPFAGQPSGGRPAMDGPCREAELQRRLEETREEARNLRRQLKAVEGERQSLQGRASAQGSELARLRQDLESLRQDLERAQARNVALAEELASRLAAGGPAAAGQHSPGRVAADGSPAMHEPGLPPRLPGQEGGASEPVSAGAAGPGPATGHGRHGDQARIATLEEALARRAATIARLEGDLEEARRRLERLADQAGQVARLQELSHRQEAELQACREAVPGRVVTRAQEAVAGPRTRSGPLPGTKDDRPVLSACAAHPVALPADSPSAGSGPAGPVPLPATPLDSTVGASDGCPPSPAGASLPSVLPSFAGAETPSAGPGPAGPSSGGVGAGPGPQAAGRSGAGSGGRSVVLVEIAGGRLVQVPENRFRPGPPVDGEWVLLHPGPDGTWSGGQLLETAARVERVGVLRCRAGAWFLDGDEESWPVWTALTPVDEGAAAAGVWLPALAERPAGIHGVRFLATGAVAAPPTFTSFAAIRRFFRLTAFDAGLFTRFLADHQIPATVRPDGIDWGKDARGALNALRGRLPVRVACERPACRQAAAAPPDPQEAAWPGTWPGGSFLRDPGDDEICSVCHEAPGAGVVAAGAYDFGGARVVIVGGDVVGSRYAESLSRHRLQVDWHGGFAGLGGVRDGLGGAAALVIILAQISHTLLRELLPVARAAGVPVVFCPLRGVTGVLRRLVEFLQPGRRKP